MTAQRVILYRSYDPLALDMVEAQLRAAEIPFVRLGQGNAPLLGVGNQIVEQLIEVSAEDAEPARELIDALAAPSADDADESDEVLAPEAEQQPRPTLRSHLMALGASLVYPGLATAYVGLPAPGFVLAVWPFAAFALEDRFPSSAALVLFAQVLPRAIDLFGAQLWLRRFGRKGPGLAGQIALALLLAAAFYAGSHMGGQLSAWVDQWQPPAVQPEP